MRGYWRMAVRVCKTFGDKDVDEEPPGKNPRCVLQALTAMRWHHLPLNPTKKLIAINNRPNSFT